MQNDIHMSVDQYPTSSIKLTEHIGTIPSDDFALAEYKAKLEALKNAPSLETTRSKRISRECRHRDANGQLLYRESAILAAPSDSSLSLDGLCPVCDHPQGWITISDMVDYLCKKRGYTDRTRVIHLANDYDALFSAHTLGGCHSDSIDPLDQAIMNEEMQSYQKREPQSAFARHYDSNVIQNALKQGMRRK